MQAPDFSHQSVLAALYEQFGLDGELSALLGERDQNLRLAAADGGRYVIKISPRGESRLDADFQIRALRHLEQRDVGLGLPRVVAALDGRYSADIGGNLLRVVTWVDGDVLRRDALTPAIAASLGNALATLGRALRDFDNGGQARELDWDLQRALGLRERTPSIGDASVRAEVEDVLEEFARDGLPRLSRLRRQVIHNDANPDNVLSNRRDQTVTGFIDFGDVLEAPLVADVAIAGSYLRDDRDPLRLLAPFVSAYHEVTPLTAEELALMHLLLRVRLATTVTMAHWRAANLGHEDEYLQQTLQEVGDAKRFLAALGGVGQREFTRELL